MSQNGLLPSLTQRVKAAKKHNPKLKAEIEIESFSQLKSLNLTCFDYILLDNFDIHSLTESIVYCRMHYPHIQIEVSGNINLKSIHQYSTLDIDRISVGSLTHSAPAFDISLLIS